MPVFRRAAHYVDNIFKGTALRQIPVEQAATFDLAINLKTAASLGLTFPDSGR